MGQLTLNKVWRRVTRFDESLASVKETALFCDKAFTRFCRNKAKTCASVLSQYWGAQLPQFTVLGSPAASVHSTGEPSCLSSQYWGAQLPQFTVLGSPAASVHSTGEPSCLSSQYWGAQLPQFTVLGSPAASVHSTGEPSCLSSQYWGAQLPQFTVLGSPAASVHSTGEPSCLSSQPVTGIFCCNTSHTVSWQVSKCLSAGRCLNTSLARIFCYSHDELIE